MQRGCRLERVLLAFSSQISSERETIIHGDCHPDDTGSNAWDATGAWVIIFREAHRNASGSKRACNGRILFQPVVTRAAMRPAC